MWYKKLLFLLLFAPSFLKAEGEELTLPYLRKKRLDVQFSYQDLRPSKDYGTIKSGLLTLSQPINPYNTFLYNLTYVTREEGRGTLGQFGVYHDWNDRIYTFSALAVATKADFLPKYRFDQDFFFKLTSKRNVVIPATISYVSYYNNQSALTLGSGLIWYLPCWVLEYRLFYETTYPGGNPSLSQTASIGYGEEGWQWIFLNAGYGRNSYLADFELDPQNINQEVVFVNLNWRRWIRQNFGFVTDLRYTNIKNAYRVYSFNIGLFTEF